MPEILKGVPSWFLMLCSMGFFSLLSFVLLKLNTTLGRFEELFDKVFEKHDDHESRLSRLEGKCESNHKD